ncbi:MAG: xanthine phosphoribosyltransferase [Erysipelotrichaceae bacterium]
MESLKKKIRQDAIIRDGNIIQVDNFLNHQLDITLLQAIGQEIYTRFHELNINKIVTIEASGIAIAAITAQYFDNIPVVFAKKKALNQDNTCYQANVFSYTKKTSYQATISKRFLNENDRILIVDDFMANGEAMRGLISLVEQANATICGCCSIIEKGFQKGGDLLRSDGYPYQSLAIIDKIDENEVTFR